jgi:hypothetical protein
VNASVQVLWTVLTFKTIVGPPHVWCCSFFNLSQFDINLAFLCLPCEICTHQQATTAKTKTTYTAFILSRWVRSGRWIQEWITGRLCVLFSWSVYDIIFGHQLFNYWRGSNLKLSERSTLHFYRVACSDSLRVQPRYIVTVKRYQKLSDTSWKILLRHH